MLLNKVSKGLCLESSKLFVLRDSKSKNDRHHLISSSLSVDVLSWSHLPELLPFQSLPCSRHSLENESLLQKLESF